MGLISITNYSVFTKVMLHMAAYLLFAKPGFKIVFTSKIKYSLLTSAQNIRLPTSPNFSAKVNA